jgi:putative transposase
MGRIARVVIPGIPHHVTQRGNDRQRIFYSDDEHCRYLALYRHYGLRLGLKTFAYCLMDNHVHWVVVPASKDALGQSFHALDTKYAGWVNSAKRRSGHLYQGRFFSCPLDEDYLWAAVRYVERNPVRAGMVARAEDYRWSSAAAHCGLRADPLLAPGFPPAGVVADWAEWLSTEDAQQTNAVRRQTACGRPCGSEAFVVRLEKLLERLLRPQKPGPKPQAPTPGQKGLF